MPESLGHRNACARTDALVLVKTCMKLSRTSDNVNTHKHARMAVVRTYMTTCGLTLQVTCSQTRTRVRQLLSEIDQEIHDRSTKKLNLHPLWRRRRNGTKSGARHAAMFASDLVNAQPTRHQHSQSSCACSGSSYSSRSSSSSIHPFIHPPSLPPSCLRVLGSSSLTPPLFSLFSTPSSTPTHPRHHRFGHHAEIVEPP